MTTVDMGPARPFTLRAMLDGKWGRLGPALCGPLERVLGMDRLNACYAAVDRRQGRDFASGALDALGVTVEAPAVDLERVPRKGPLVVVANHPFGGLDGLILASLLRKVRQDVRVMANYLLARVPELRETMLFVDPFGGVGATQANVAGVRGAVRHLQGGGALVVFPAGEVSRLDLRRRAIVEPAWSETVARIVRLTRAAVVPVYFHGSNSALFNVLGTIHPRLRTAMLGRELLNKRHARVRVAVGSAIPFAKLETIASDSELTAYLRLRTYILQTRGADKAARAGDAWEAERRAVAMEPIVAAEDPVLVRADVEKLPAEALLLESGEFAVYVARAGEIPHALAEIGRLREITFRGTHEGTGKATDLDAFDEDYLHLFCWSKARREIVGAYRMGQSDAILPRKGVPGLYTRTLFRYEQKLLDSLGPALELGRSFIRAEYQRSYAPLLMLWKGIGTFVARNPRYQVLFGPVSINNQYQSVSRQLIMTFLRTTSFSPLAGMIRPTNPPRIGPLRGEHLQSYSTVVRDIEDVSDLVQEIEHDRKGIPVLLKQYMKLSARLLGFNVDPDFGDVLDGLILVDFRRIPARLVERFCGKAGAAKILAYGAGGKSATATSRGATHAAI